MDKMDIEIDYPIGLKYFTQYVLLPLVAIYLGILIAYEAKIAIQWSLPQGWVSIMVLASAIFGILAFLLIYPRQRSQQMDSNLHQTLLLDFIAISGLDDGSHLCQNFTIWTDRTEVFCRTFGSLVAWGKFIFFNFEGR